MKNDYFILPTTVLRHIVENAPSILRGRLFVRLDARRCFCFLYVSSDVCFFTRQMFNYRADNRKLSTSWRELPITPLLACLSDASVAAITDTGRRLILSTGERKSVLEAVVIDNSDVNRLFNGENPRKIGAWPSRSTLKRIKKALGPRAAADDPRLLIADSSVFRVENNGSVELLAHAPRMPKDTPVTLTLSQLETFSADKALDLVLIGGLCGCVKRVPRDGSPIFVFLPNLCESWPK